MTPKQLIFLKKRIQEAVRELEKDIERLETSSQTVAPDNALGRLTRMETMQDQKLSEAALHRKQERLYQLLDALDAIDDPVFGHCEVCRQAIDFERLKAMPEARRCMRCSS